MKKNGIVQMILALVMVTVSGCENDNCCEECNNNEQKVELSVLPTLSMTRSIISGTDASVLGSIAVYASGNGYVGDSKAVYSYANSTWSNNGASKILLSNEPAVITAHYPSSATATSGAIGVSTLSSGSVNVSTGDASTIYGDAGETDYMWAAVTNVAGAAVNTTNRNPSVNLTMNHALSRVSFRVYKDTSYSGTGNLTKIELQNVGAATTLNKGTNPTLNIANGTITMNAASAASYTRNVTGYSVGTAATSAKAVSMIVFPAEDIVANSIKVTMTVDGVEYTTMVPAPESGSWLAGINYLYTAKLSGTDLVISSNNILLTDWNSITVSGELALQ